MTKPKVSIQKDIALINNSFIVVKDLANLTPGRSNLQRRHSITICESKSKRKTSVESSTSSGDSSNSSSPKNLSPRQSRCGDLPQQPQSLHPHAAAPFSLNVSKVQQTLQNEYDNCQPSKSEALKTLNLRLDEVAHIRSVLTKAQLETLPIEGSERDNVEKGKVSS